MSILGMLLLGGAAAAVAGAFDDKKEPESKVLGQRFALPTESENRSSSSSENDVKRWQTAPWTEKKEYLSNNEYHNKYLANTTEAKRNRRNEAWEYYKQITPHPTSEGFEVWLDGRS